MNRRILLVIGIAFLLISFVVFILPTNGCTSQTTYGSGFRKLYLQIFENNTGESTSSTHPNLTGGCPITEDVISIDFLTISFLSIGYYIYKRQ